MREKEERDGRRHAMAEGASMEGADRFLWRPVMCLQVAGSSEPRAGLVWRRIGEGDGVYMVLRADMVGGMVMNGKGARGNGGASV